MIQKRTEQSKDDLFLKLISILICFTLCLAQPDIFATTQQMKQIRGTVVDPKGEPLVGVSVQLKNVSGIGTITDMNGAFSLATNVENPVLEFSYLGFKSQSVPVTGASPVHIILEEDIEQLDEVVVVGYGVQKKATLTGAISSVNAEQLSTSTNSNLQQNLAGKLAGVKIITNSSEPGALKSRIDLRGMGTPLIVIDGVTSNVETFSQLSGDEIENISVLKDASAAVYGMRAGNGVLLVTTKKGSSGKPKFEYRGVYGFSHLLTMPKMMNAYDWADMINEITESRYSGARTTYSEEQMESFKGVPAFDLWSMFMKDYVPQTEHTISVSGSAGNDEAVQYFVTGSYLNEDGAYKSGSMNYQRYNFRSNVSAKLAYGLKANVNVGLIKADKKQPYQEAWNQIKWMWFVPPIHPQTGLPQTSIYANDNPEYPAYFGTELNPVINADSDNGGGFKKYEDHIWNIQGTLEWDAPFLKGLSARFMYNYNRKDRLYQSWNQEYTLYTYRNEEYIPAVYASPTTMVQDVHWSSNNGIQASLNYVGSWNEHSINLLALFEQNQYQGQYQGAQRFYTMDFLPYLSAGDNDKTQVIGSSYPSLERRQGFVGRLNYDYAGKYLAEFAFRYDGSSKYKSSEQWGFFPSALIGWRISEETFFKKISALKFINNLKIRASYGITGDDGGAAYQWASGYNYPGSIYYFGDQKMMSVNDRGATNPYFTWYENKLSNLGLDINMWNGLLNVTAEVFKRKRSGLPARRNLTIPGTIGIGLPEENLNSDETKGWEINLTHSNKIGEVRYDVSGNFMYARTKRLYLERAESTSSYKNWRDNASYRYDNIWWCREWAGVIKPGTDISSLPNEEGAYQNSMLSIGDYYHTDLNGDGWVDGEDVAPLRTFGYPPIQYGLTLNVIWKSFDVNLHFMGAAKKYVLYNEFLKTPYAFTGQAGALDIHRDRWHQDEDGNWISGHYPRYSELQNNLHDDTKRIMNASYFRLKSAELGYTIPKELTKKLGLERLRIYANGFNLLTFTGLKYMDPEYPGWNVNNPESGDDTTWGYIYPISMNFNFGVNVTF